MNLNHCAECQDIVSEMRAAFLKLMSKRPEGNLSSRDDLVQFLSQLFSSEPQLKQLEEEWNEGIGGVRHKWMEHRIATGHVPVLLSAMN